MKAEDEAMIFLDKDCKIHCYCTYHMENADEKLLCCKKLTSDNKLN